MKALLTALLAATLATACTTSPTGRNQIILVSDDEMAQMGATAFTQMKEKTPGSKDVRTNSYVQCVAREVTAVMGSQSWEVQVFESKDVNAFALPGGKIGVYTGLLKVAQNQDQLAAVIGHEVAHVIAKHSSTRMSSELLAQGVIGFAAGQTKRISPEVMSNFAGLFFLLPNSRGDETEADVLGLDYMAKAGFDPRQAPELWRNMAKASKGAPPEFLSTHPSNESRIRDLNNRLPIALPLYEQAQASGKRPRCS